MCLGRAGCRRSTILAADEGRAPRREGARPGRRRDSGLEAARAIGPKLAEQAVLIRANGIPQDLRLPLPDGAEIQILTTRNTDDPDALHVLRHSAAHLLAEAVMRLYAGVKIAIGPPVDDGFYYDFEFPEPITRRGSARRSRTRSAVRSPRGARSSARRRPRRRPSRASTPRASRTRSSSSGRRRATSRSTPRAPSPTSAAARTCRPRHRSRRSSSPRSRGRTGAATRTTPS